MRFLTIIIWNYKAMGNSTQGYIIPLNKCELMKKLLILLPILFLCSEVNAQELDYPVSVSYIDGTVYQSSDNSFSLLSGSKWAKSSMNYLLTTSDIFIIVTDEKGNGIAYSDGSEFAVKYLSGSTYTKNGRLNLVTKSYSNGAVLKMVDGSLWEIDSYDQYDTGYWLPPYHVIITNNELYLINFKKGKKIWASKAN